MLCHINTPAYVFVFVRELLLKLQSQDTRVYFSFKQEGATACQMMLGYHMRNFLMALVINVLIPSTAS